MSTTTTMSTEPLTIKSTKPDILHLTTPSSPKEPRSTLDALVSPTADEPPPTSPSAAATAPPESTNDEDEDEDGQAVDISDDGRFSTVPLSATTTPREPSLTEPSATQRSSISSTTNMEVSLLTPRTSISASHGSAKLGLVLEDKKKQTRRPASLVSPAQPDSTTSTNPHAEFILAKLEKDLMSPTAKSMRGSMDGKNILQAEFDHARKAKEDDAESITADGINWGRFVSLLVDT